MRATKFVWIVCIFSILVFGSKFSLAADVAKIGVINIQKVFETSDVGKAKMAELKAKANLMLTDLQKKKAEIDELSKRLERESMVMSKEMREDKEREHRIKINDFQSLERSYQREGKKLGAQFKQQMLTDIFAITQEMGKKGGYLLIIDSPNVVYAPTSVDLTDKLIQELNKKSAKDKK